MRPREQHRGTPPTASHEHERGERGDRMPSGVAARATDSWSMTDTSLQPLLAPSAAVDPANQPIPGAQPTCENTHQGQGQEKFTTRAGRGQCWSLQRRAMLSHIAALSARRTRTACTGWAGGGRAWVAAHLSLGQLFSCQRTPRRPTSPSVRYRTGRLLSFYFVRSA